MIALSSSLCLPQFLAHKRRRISSLETSRLWKPAPSEIRVTSIYETGAFLRYIYNVEQSRHGQHPRKTKWSEYCHYCSGFHDSMASLHLVASSYVSYHIDCSASSLH